MKKLIYLSICFGLFVNPGFSQENSGKPVIMKSTYFDISPPLRDMVQDVNAKADQSWKYGAVKNTLNTLSNDTENWEPSSISPIAQTYFGQVLTDTTLQNFEGVSMAGYFPPDTDGDVGPEHYFQVTNVRFSIYDKTGVKLVGPSQNSSIFAGMPHNNNDGDAIVLYDENADRWLFSQFSLPNFPNGPFYENVAISQTPDPTGAWYRYQFTFSDMPDYPKLSVWGDGYYMTIRRFASGSLNWLGPAVVAMDRSLMLTGVPASTMVMFNLPSSCEGPQAADCDSDFPPDTTPCPVCYIVSGTNASIKINHFDVDWTTPANSSLTLANTVSISNLSTFGNGPNIPQKGTSQKLDAMSGKRIMFRMPFRKFPDHWSMLFNTTEKLTGAHAGLRWMEVRNTGSGWSLYQEGTYAPDEHHRWMGSIAMDSVGNIALGYSISSSTMYPSIRYTGRMNADPLGVMTIAERGIWNGTASQTFDPQDGRWGDYSAMAADPTVIGKFWYTQQYIIGGNWKTRIASFSFANVLSVNATATPDIICHAGDTSQLNVVASGGSGTFTYSWTSIPAGFTSNIQNPIVTPAETTIYIASADDGTQTKTDTVTVLLQPLPTAYAGADTSHCWYEHKFMISGTAENYGAVKWKTSGDGAFSTNSALNVFYYPGDIDRANGSVTLSLVAYSMVPCNDSVSDEMFVDLICVGVQPPESDKFAVSLQPNPSSGVFFVNISGVRDQMVNVTVLDLHGKIVYSDAVKSGSRELIKKLDLSSLSKGTYIIKIQTGKEQKVDKIVIQ